MKPIRLVLLLVSALLLASTSSYAYVVAPQSAEAAAAYKDASSRGLSAKEMKKELRAQLRYPTVYEGVAAAQAGHP